MSKVKCISEFVTDNYRDYGKYVALHRAVPHIDGLKPVQRRILLGLRKIAKGKLVSTVNAIGEISKYHPFGDLSLANSIAEMARIKSIDSQGSFGIKLLEKIPHAAPRYTKVGMTTEQADYFFMLDKYTNDVEGEEQMEPEFLICPVPYALMYGSFSWGVGLISRMPAFTYKSLLAAHAADDPYLLESQYGYKINHSDSNMESLWYHGIGRVSFEMKVSRLDANTILISGSGESFAPAVETFRKDIEEGQITIENRSKNKIDVIVKRTYRARLVDMDDVYERCLKIASKIRKYQIQVVYNEEVITIGIKDWLDITLNHYKNTHEKYRADRIAKLEKEMEVFSILPKVGQLVLDNKTNNHIADKLKTTLEVIEECVSKSISMLRKKDHDAKIASIKINIDKVSTESVDDIINNYYKGE